MDGLKERFEKAKKTEIRGLQRELQTMLQHFKAYVIPVAEFEG